MNRDAPPRDQGGGADASHDPYVSIVIAVRNGAATLETCLASVFDQRSTDWELVVIDGASTDGTTEILRHHDERIAFWVSEPDTGVYNAWNKALRHVRGRWVQFLGADDRLASPASLTAIERALREADGRYRVVYGTVRLVNGDRAAVATWGEPWSTIRRSFRRGMFIPHPGTFHHRSLFDQHGQFDESFRIGGDYEFLLRELLDAEALFVPELVVEMGSGGLSTRPENQIALTVEGERARRLHGLGRGRPEWAPSVLRLRLKLAIERVFGPSGVAAAARVYRATRGRPSR